MPERARRALAAVEIEELVVGATDNPVRAGSLRRVRFLNKLAALDALGKHLGLFTEKLDPSLGQHTLHINLVQYGEETSER
jgi:hypothetical protein